MKKQSKKTAKKSLSIKKNKSKRMLIISVILAILIVGAGVFFWWTNNQNKNNDFSTTKKSTEENQKKDSDNKKTAESKNNKGENKDMTNQNDSMAEQSDDLPGLKTKPMNTDTPPAANKQENGIYNIAMGVTVSNDNGQYRISGFTKEIGATQAGDCTLTLTGPNGKTIKKDIPILPISPSGLADCETQYFPAGQLSPGNWTANVKYKADNGKGEASESFTVE